MRGAGDSGRAGRTRRGGQAAGVETEQQRVSLAAGEREVGVGRQAALTARSRQPSAVDGGFDAGDEAVAQAGQPRRPRLEIAGDEFDRRGEATAPATSRVPERTPRSCPPPWRMGVGAAERSSRSAPMPTGPPILCAVIVIAVAPISAKSSGICPSAWTASMWKGTPSSAAAWPISRSGCRVPISLFAAMTLMSAVASGSRRSSARAASRSRRPVESTSRSTTSAPRSASQSTESSTAWCSILVVSTRGRVGASNEPLLRVR